MEQAVSHSSLKSLRGHRMAAECVRPKGPSPGHLHKEGKMGALRHQARNYWLSWLNGPLLSACKVRGGGREASRILEFRAKANPIDPKPHSLVPSKAVVPGRVHALPSASSTGGGFHPHNRANGRGSNLKM